MVEKSLETYCQQALNAGATHAKQIKPSSIVTASWVRWKCQYGCPNYGRSYCCPPDSPTPEETKSVISAYRRAILFHMEIDKKAQEKGRRGDIIEQLVTLEGNMFKDGFYKAFLISAGPCRLCQQCGKLTEESCKFSKNTRPSMEACGIDVYQTARNNGYFIRTLKAQGEPQNWFCLMLVD